MVSIERNLNGIDRSIRSIIALGCIYTGFIDPSYIEDLFLAGAIGGFGIINLIAVALGSCPFYIIAGISTLKPGVAQEQ